MEQGIRKANLIQKSVILCIFLLAGLGLLVSGIFDVISGTSTINKSKAVDENYAEVTATISDIQIKSAGDDYEYGVYVTYTYEGQLYEDIKLNYYSSRMHKGDDVDILCKKEQPETIKGANSTSFLVSFTAGFAGMKIFMAVIVLIISITGLINTFRKETTEGTFSNSQDQFANSGAVGANGMKLRVKRAHKNSVVFGILFMNLLIFMITVGAAVWINPTGVFENSSPGAGIVLFAMGALFVIFVGIMIKKQIQARNDKKKAMQNGIVVWATVEEITLDTSVRKGGKCPNKLYCCYEPVKGGERFYFSSEAVWNDLRGYFAPGDQVKVHVMPDDYSRYYFSLEENLAKMQDN